MKMTKKHILMVMSIVVAATFIFSSNVLANIQPTLQFKLKDFLTSTNGQFSAENILSFKTPREITIHAPKKVIEQVEVLHKKGDALGKEDVSITNVDIITTEEVDTINITVRGVQRPITNFESNGNKRMFSVGYAGLVPDFDIRIEAFGSAESFEVMNFRVPEGSSDIFKISQKFSYKTAGKKYTLYDLLAGKNLFTDLLVEHRLEDIDAEYVD